MSSKSIIQFWHTKHIRFYHTIKSCCILWKTTWYYSWNTILGHNKILFWDTILEILIYVFRSRILIYVFSPGILSWNTNLCIQIYAFSSRIQRDTILGYNSGIQRDTILSYYSGNTNLCLQIYAFRSMSSSIISSWHTNPCLLSQHSNLSYHPGIQIHVFYPSIQVYVFF